jgi:hypothetical protein
LGRIGRNVVKSSQSFKISSQAILIAIKPQTARIKQFCANGGVLDEYLQVYFKGKRRHDCSNASFCAKLIEDVFVKQGILPDDNSNVIRRLMIEVITGAEEDYVVIRFFENK